MKTKFQEQIEEVTRSSIPMHMPGHKRNVAMLGDDLPYSVDVTEIDGADDLHDPEADGIIGSLCEKYSSLYGARSARPLINGSTCGILAGIRTLTSPGDSVIVARNCHKSVWHAIEICRLNPTCILPPITPEHGICDAITAEAIEEAFERSSGATCVILTSPTYEGVISDIDAISSVCKKHGAALFVDAAHGAHLGFSNLFPDFPRGADIAVTSLHKTLPALTQTALGLVFNEKYSSRFARNLGIFETSSPSYILMNSIAKCADILADGNALFDNYRTILDEFYASTNPSKLNLIKTDDIGKISISTRNTTFTGSSLADALRSRFSIEPEMVHSDYLLCMTSVCDTRETLSALSKAIMSLDEEAEYSDKKSIPSFITELPPAEIPLHDAVWLDLEGREDISDAYVWVYPPGIPILLPGEKVTEEIKNHLEMLKNSGISPKIIKTS
ncbi:MAG: aminotransferase class V-fold PLP-dependent enzyme [Clostridia bacterium]|nr:aminotransferase class V-fold PLP-dependent enzyme [Clostridia bacterium]